MEVAYKGYTLLLDEVGPSILQAFNWQIEPQQSGVYFQCKVRNDGKYVTIKLHRILAGATVMEGRRVVTNSKLVVDHINGNNRKENLRLCTISENSCNHTKLRTDAVSGYVGISYRKDRNKWRATANKNKKQYFFGNFDTKEEALQAYRVGIVNLHGEFTSKLSEVPST
jgi:hypothetical protein